MNAFGTRRTASVEATVINLFRMRHPLCIVYAYVCAGWVQLYDRDALSSWSCSDDESVGCGPAWTLESPRFHIASPNFPITLRSFFFYDTKPRGILLAELLFGVAFLAHRALLAPWFCSRCNGKCMKSIFAFVALVLYVAGFSVLLSFFRSGARKAPVQVDGVRWSYGAYIGFAGAAFYWTGFT